MDELTEFQYNSLSDAVASGNRAFVYMQPENTETTDKQTRYKNQVEELLKLVNMGLLSNISEKFKDRIQLTEESQNRTFVVFKITDTAWTMFDGAEERPVN